MKKHFFIVLVGVFLLILSSCSEPFESMKNKTWAGGIYRTSDEQELSLVYFKLKEDSMFIFSNAIFGSDNDTLLLDKCSEKDSTFSYKSPKGQTYSFRMYKESEDGIDYYYWVEKDFYMWMVECEEGIQDSVVTSFYLNKSVPREPCNYLFGTYKGEIEPQNQLVNMFFFGPIKVKMKFVENFRVKLFFNSVLSDVFSDGAPNYEIVEYSIRGNKLFLKRNKSKINEIEILNHGKRLAVSTDEMDLVLYKTQ